jgi:integrase
MELFSVTDLKLMQLIQRRNLSKEREKQYNTVFKELFFLLGKTPTQLLEEAKEEQQPYLDKNGFPRILPMDDRKVNSYQFIYHKYLNDKGNAETTKKEKINSLRSFLREYYIDLPRPIKFHTRPNRLRITDIPTWQDVRNSLDYCKNSREKAIVSFIATSGIRESNVVKFTIKNFLDATAIYHNGTMDDLLVKNPFDIIPCYDFMPVKTANQGNLCITFNTGECSYYIFEYLKKRIKEGYSLNPEDPLFRGLKHPHFMKPAVILRLFQRLNKELKLGKDKNGVYGKFRSHNLRKLFSTTCRRNITKININTDIYTELDIISVFTGHTPPNMSNTEVYDAVDNVDGINNYLRMTYEALTQYMTINPQLYNETVKNSFLEENLIVY